MIFLDYETRSRADLRRCGQSAYAADPSTRVLCMAYAEAAGPVEVWTPGEPLPEFFADPAVELHAFNAPFERAITAKAMSRLYPAIAEVPLRRWHCTAARAAAVGLPRRLETCAKALGLAEKKDAEGHRVMMKMTRPRKPSKNNPAEWHDDPADFEKLLGYCAQDVVVEREIHNATPDLTPRERVVWLLDQVINGRGIPLDLALVSAAIECDQQHAAELTAELAALTGGAVKTANQVERLVRWLATNGVDVGDVQAATIDSELATATGDVRRVLEIRRTLGRASVAKYRAMADRADADGRVRGAHVYHQATTGRWAGTGVQTQNIPGGAWVYKAAGTDDASIAQALEDAAATIARGPAAVAETYGDVSRTLSGMIRPAICAPEGRDFIVCDFAAIEARVLAWLAAQRDLVEQFEQDADVYLTLASEIYGRECTKADKSERQLGKIARLGLGYGMGAGTRPGATSGFLQTCAKFGISLEAEFADHVVDVYRRANRCVVRYWYGLNDAAIEAARGSEPVDYMAHRIEKRDRWLFLRLPSGREIAYPDPKVCKTPTPWGEDKWQLSYKTLNSVTRQWTRERTYGGKLVENVVQATARDILVDAMFRLEARGYRVVFHVHDEAVTEQPTTFGSVEEVEAIMAERPAWAAGCPIGAEGFRTRRYRK